MSYAMIAVELIKIMKGKSLDPLRQSLKQSKNLIKWEEVAEKWLEEV
jgi:hypothetical protein